MTKVMHVSNARTMLKEGSERAFVEETLEGLLAVLKDKDAKIKRLENIEGRLDLAIAMLPTFDPDGPGDCTDRLVEGVKRLYPVWAVVEAARNVQFKPQNDEPYLALQDTLKALDNKQ